MIVECRKLVRNKEIVANFGLPHGKGKFGTARR